MNANLLRTAGHLAAIIEYTQLSRREPSAQRRWPCHLLVALTVALQPASHMRSARVMVGPVNHAALLVPFVFAMERHPVAAHGNFDSAKCLNGHDANIYEVERACRAGTPMTCAKCGEFVKPDIVFFGENLPRRFFECAQKDFEVCDLLIVIGTSLVVHPFAGLIERPKEHVPRLLINLERCGEAQNTRVTNLYRMAGLGRGTGFDFDEATNYRDALFLGQCDDGVAELCSMLGWKDELDALIENCAIKKRLQASKISN